MSTSSHLDIRWGVLGAARIATTRVIPAIQQARHGRVVALASRDLRKAERAAAASGVPRAYGSYEALLADPDVDAVYIPLPNHLHVPWSTRSAEAGKHVLCEKPIALNADEARTLLDVRDRTGMRIQEAFMIRVHPQWRRASAIVASGELGEVSAMSGFFSYYNVDPENVRNRREWGGGGLLDIGCYLVNTARLVFAAEPVRVAATLAVDPVSGVDRLASMILDFGGRHAIGTCGTQLQYHQRIEIVGTRGRLTIEVPFNAPPDRPLRLLLDRTGDLSGRGIEAIEVEAANQFTIQADEFARGILDGTPQHVPLEDAVANMACIDALVRSSAADRWESP